MSPVEVKENSEEQSNEIRQSQESSRASIANKLMASPVFKSLDIPKDLEAEEVEEVQEKPVKEEPEKELDQEQEEEQEPDETDLLLKDDEEEEEVIPKSKIQPRIDKLTSQIKDLKARLEERESKESSSTDDTVAKLEAMSMDDLKTLRRQVRIAAAKNSGDDVQLNQLIDLEEKIDSVMSEAPAKFAQAQIRSFNRAAESISEDETYDEKDAPKILEAAKSIYQKYPKLQKDVDGQAIALQLAADHIKSLKSSNGNRDEVINLKTKVNNLKKRSNLDTKTSKSNMETGKVDQLRKTALTGTSRDKIRFVRDNPSFNVDAMIPDELK